MLGALLALELRGKSKGFMMDRINPCYKGGVKLSVFVGGGKDYGENSHTSHKIY
jgi:hypothetical protein